MTMIIPIIIIKYKNYDSDSDYHNKARRNLKPSTDVTVVIRFFKMEKEAVHSGGSNPRYSSFRNDSGLTAMSRP